MKRVERVLGLIIVLELYETVALGCLGAKVQRYVYLYYVAESTKLVF